MESFVGDVGRIQLSVHKVHVNLSLCPCYVMFDTCKIKRFDYFDLDLESRLHLTRRFGLDESVFQIQIETEFGYGIRIHAYTCPSNNI